MSARYGFELRRIIDETFVARIDFAEIMPSTNDRARAWIDAPNASPAIGADDGPLLVLAGRQTAGRGRSDHRWWSPPGALAFSLLLEQPPQTPLAPAVSVRSALAVADALTELLPAALLQVRWPNDVYAARKKICGILPEGIQRGERRWLVLGIGINVNNSPADAPADVRQRAISMAELAGEPFDRIDVLIRVLRALEPELGAAEGSRLTARWRQRCMLTGRSICLDHGGSQWKGRCLGIDEAGRLLIETAAGVQALASGSVLECRESRVERGDRSDVASR